MIQQQLSIKYSALKISGMNIQMMRSTWDFFLLAVADVWEKGFSWKFFLSRATIGFSALVRAVFQIAQPPCYRYYYVNLKPFFEIVDCNFNVCYGCFL